MTDDAKCYAATPAATLEQHITDSNVPKNDAEWWAYHEITRLREKNELLMQAWNEEKGFLNKYIDKIEYLREENARLREALKPFAEKEYAYEGWADIARAEVWLNVRDIRAAAAAIREGGE